MYELVWLFYSDRVTLLFIDPHNTEQFTDVVLTADTLYSTLFKVT